MRARYAMAYGTVKRATNYFVMAVGKLSKERLVQISYVHVSTSL